MGLFQETMVLPSGGDTGYPGFIIVGDELWVSCYASYDTGKAAIYLANLPPSLFRGFSIFSTKSTKSLTCTPVKMTENGAQ